MDIFQNSKFAVYVLFFKIGIFTVKIHHDKKISV